MTARRLAAHAYNTGDQNLRLITDGNFEIVH